MPRQATLVAVLLASAVNAHFSIKFPEQNSPSDENSLDEGPCGGASLDFSSKTVTDFHVGGDAIALTPTHPQANWLFRATTDTKGEGNWTQIFPIFQQGGLGELCQPDVSVPEDFAGKQGLISVVANAEDGVLYGCSQVKFVEGKADSRPSDCRNTTQALSFTSDDKLSALVSSGSGSNSPPPSGSGTQGAPAGSNTPGAAPSLHADSLPAGLITALSMITVALFGGAAFVF